jgi:hypothetical protein
LRQGIDPAAHRRRVKAAQAESLANTFGTVADELLARKKRDGVASVTASKVEWLLGMAKASLSQCAGANALRSENAERQRGQNSYLGAMATRAIHIISDRDGRRGEWGSQRLPQHGCPDLADRAAR